MSLEKDAPVIEKETEPEEASEENEPVSTEESE